MTDTSGSTIPYDGGPAFPVPLPEHPSGSAGMSRRAWLAGMAMHAIIISDELAKQNIGMSRSSTANEVAGSAYQMALAMLRYEQEEK